MELERAHGLGNDYLVLVEGEPLDAHLVRALCDRHTGVGADGILEPREPGPADYGVRIWNPDGSVAEKSGNGLRIMAWWLHRTGAPRELSLWTGHDTVHCVVGDEAIEVEMGTARFESPVEAPLAFAGERRPAVVVDLGNPHCVLFVDAPDLDALPWQAWGQALETHPRFPERTNVQVARLRTGGDPEIRIWERGAGPTRASGSSSCAVAAAAVRTGRRAPGAMGVHMPGGTLRITVRDDYSLRLAGPVEGIGTVRVDDGWLARRR